MHPALFILIAIAGGALAFWLVLLVYGLIRKNKTTDRRRSRVRLTEDGGGADGGGADGH